jgi:hypothetical protein
LCLEEGQASSSVASSTALQVASAVPADRRHNCEDQAKKQEGNAEWPDEAGEDDYTYAPERSVGEIPPRAWHGRQGRDRYCNRDSEVPIHVSSPLATGGGGGVSRTPRGRRPRLIGISIIHGFVAVLGDFAWTLGTVNPYASQRPLSGECG